MKMTYYPGCSLQGTARDYNESILEICSKLAVDLIEIPDWNCCGASSAHMTNHEVAMRLAIRNLLQIRESTYDVLIPCSACFQRLKAADLALREDPLFWDVDGYAPQFELVHITSFLSRQEVLEHIRKMVKKPITDMPIACYYGCLSLRPPHITGIADHEMPTALESIVTAVGGSPAPWSHRSECCSGSLTMTRPDIARKLVSDIVGAARRGGATAMLTDCPMCQANVESRQIDLAPAGPHLPVYYVTELIAAALNGEYPQKTQNFHLVPAEELQKHLSLAATNREEAS